VEFVPYWPMDLLRVIQKDMDELEEFEEYKYIGS
jgi:hypothetical protein